MLNVLGLTTRDELVYTAMLRHRDLDLAALAALLQIDQDAIRSALDNLVDLALVRIAADGERMWAVRPRAGLAALLARAEADLAARQLEIEKARSAFADQFDEESADELQRHEGLDSVQDRLAEMAAVATTECLSFSTGGAQLPQTIEAERPLNLQALERGVVIRNVYLDSFRNDAETLAYARWMAQHGSQSRTVAALPMRMVVIDRATALVPLDPTNQIAGALEIRSPGVIAGLVALFEQVWSTGTPFGDAPARDAAGLSGQERELLRLYAQGHTDESAARRLALSVRTVQRMMTTLGERLQASSRFQAGVEATRRGWI